MLRTNFDKYHPGYFGKVGMRRFHLTRNLQWRPIINVDKLWTLVPAEEKANLKEDSEVVPVIDTLRAGYAKVLGNGQCVLRNSRFSGLILTTSRIQAAQAPLHRKSSFRLEDCRVSFAISKSPLKYSYICRRKIKEAGGVVKLVA